MPKKQSYHQHQELLQKCALLIQARWPSARFFSRHVGLFYTRTGHPVKIGIPGQADAYIYMPTKYGLTSIEIEFKTGTGKQSPAQKNWESIIKGMGGIYIVARNEQDLIYEIESELTKKGMAMD